MYLFDMNYVKLLLSEGRREDLIGKYVEDFGPSLMVVLDDEFSRNTNYKYVDWIFSKAPKRDRTTQPSIDKGLNLVKEFDKLKANLTKKDINQYESIEELKSVIDKYLSEKGPEPKVEKIYEDNKFVVVIPKNEAASCKYGANTQWCVTSRGSGYYESYTTGLQMLYFIINKANSTDKMYSKVAIHYNGIGTATYWDSQNNVLGGREISILKYAFPEIFEKIENHYNTTIYNNKSKKTIKYLNDVFSNYAANFKIEEGIFGTHYNLNVSVQGFDLINDLGEGHSYGFVAISIWNEKTNQTKKIDGYEMFITFRLEKESKVYVEVGFMGEGESDFDTGFEQKGYKFVSDLSAYSTSQTSNQIRSYIAEKMLDTLKKDNGLKKYIKSLQ